MRPKAALGLAATFQPAAAASNHFANRVLEHRLQDAATGRRALGQRFGKMNGLFERGLGGHGRLVRIDERFDNRWSARGERLPYGA